MRPATFRVFMLASVCAFLTASAVQAQTQDDMASPSQFTDVTQAAGIDFHLTCGSAEKRHVMGSLCGGAAFFDYDNDGWMDLLLVNGATVATLKSLKKGNAKPSRLYRNRGDGTFEDVTKRAGLDFRGWGMGAATGDYDNDGWVDVYITHLLGGALFRNRGDGTFEDVTKRSGADNGGRWGASAAFGDYDNDGHLDLYVANYLRVDLDNLPEFGSGPLCNYRGVDVYCGPRGLTGARDRLYHNRGDGTFEDVTDELSIDPDSHFGLGVLWWDYDIDGDADIYVANDSTPSLLYRNNGDGTFEEVGLETGVALSADGREQAGMGVDAGDYDNDGLPDLIKTNFSHDTNNLYHNDGDGWFTDLGGEAGTARANLILLGFGIRFLDFNNDGWKDIFVANGHVYPQMDGSALGTTYAQRDLLFRNRGGGRFEEMGGSALSTSISMTGGVSRGAASADFDNDGDIDLLVTRLDGSPVLLRNDSEPGNWIRIRLRGTVSNRDGLGARVRIVAGEIAQTAEARCSSSYLTSNDPRLHFGLGGAKRVKRIEVRWPSGAVDRIEDVEANQELTIEEGKGGAPR